MMHSKTYDDVLVRICDYTMSYVCTNHNVLETARYALLDAIGCGLLALRVPECAKHIGPFFPVPKCLDCALSKFTASTITTFSQLFDHLIESGTHVDNGCHVPGTQFVLDPVQAAFNISCMNRWLDYNDTLLYHEWGHPSDNLGAILAVAEYVSNLNLAKGQRPFTMGDVIQWLIKAYEIQGGLSMHNSFNAVGLDHVILVKVACTAICTLVLGGDREDILAALSQAWIDGQSLRTYRHWPNTGSRKSWAAADASSRAVRLSMITMRGEMGYKTPLTAPTWGFYDVSFNSKSFTFSMNFSDYIMENVLFKVTFPAEFHAQTAVEAAISLHPQVINQLDSIESIVIHTHLSAIRIINKNGPLKNEADRDHCIQYMVAIGLLFGNLKAEHYEDRVAADERIDVLRAKMQVDENPAYSESYLDPKERSVANAIQIKFKDGSETERVEVMYPLGHRRRRVEAIPHIKNKFIHNLHSRFPKKQGKKIEKLCLDSSLESFMEMTVTDFVQLFVI